MDRLNLLRAAHTALQLASMFATTSLAAQTVPPAETPQPAPTTPSQDVPLLQLETPTERVIAPPPVASPEVARAPLPPQPPPCDTSAQPSPCTQPVDAYVHDGFYFRVMNESQYLTFRGRGPDGKTSITGLGSGGIVAIGGTPLPGLVIAGVLGSSTLRANFKGGPDPERDANMASAMIGVMVDWYPVPTDGWNVGAALGFAGITLTDAAIPDAVGAAFAAKIFGGYDWWIGPQWSLGLSAVLGATPSTSLRDSDGDSNGYRFYTLSAGLAGSVILH